MCRFFWVNKFADSYFKRKKYRKNTDCYRFFFTIKASELSEKKHWEKCMECVLGSHCNYIVCMPEKNQKTFLKPIALWAKMLYTNKACVRRWCGKLPCYRRISTENCPHKRWGRRDSLSFYCVKNIRNTRKRVQRRQNHVHVENSARSDDCGTKRSPQPKAS